MCTAVSVVLTSIFLLLFMLPFGQALLSVITSAILSLLVCAGE
jgi:hypothetical protein